MTRSFLSVGITSFILSFILQSSVLTYNAHTYCDDHDVWQYNDTKYWSSKYYYNNSGGTGDYATLKF